jgi:hypothetical protein
MASAVPDLNPHIRAAFDEACVAVFKIPVQRSFAARELREVLHGFATHYRQLSALPRRARRLMERRWKRTLSAIALLMALGQTPAMAANIHVSPGTPPSIKADGRCSLIEAIVNANRDARPHLDCVAGSGADTIVLPAQSRQVLHGKELLPQITSRIVIEGHRSTVLRNTATNLTFFSVGSSGNLTLNETTVTGAFGDFFSRGYGVHNSGRVELNDSGIADAGGIFNSGGVAVLNHSIVTGNVGNEYRRGGGILNEVADHVGGKLFVTNSVISGNTAYSGGGIGNGKSCSATLTDSIVSDNRARFGGGVSNALFGSLVLTGTTVANNRAQRGGAGIANTGTAMVRRSTIVGNSLYGAESPYCTSISSFCSSAGISNGVDYYGLGGYLTLVNSTVSNNEGRTRGGGVGSDGGDVTIVSSTVTRNSLTDDTGLGGGVFVRSGWLALRRSIVSGNGAHTGREMSVAPGVVITFDEFNLFGHDGEAGVTGFTPGSSDIVPNKSIGGILLPLADNGGETRTHALAIGSPALDASPDDDGCPTIDQRESPRPHGAACDIGSFEGSAVMCNGRVTTMVGTDGPDELTGTSGSDVIAGLGGDDTIGALGGNDLVCAGGGADEVSGGAGNDVLFGQGGDDLLIGNGGNDTLNGGAGQDLCNGGPGAGDTATACETVNTVP